MRIVPNLWSKSWHFSSSSVSAVEIPRTCLSSEQKTALARVVDKYFRNNESEFGCTDAVEHEIIVTDPSPIKQRNYAISPKVQESINAELDKIIAHGIVEPSSSGWNSPVLMIPKKDGGMRFCVDNRRLNQVTQKDAYPLPRIFSILNKLRDAKYLSSLDIKSAYWQVPLSASNRQNAAFAVSGRRLFQFCRLFFGLTNAPAVFTAYRSGYWTRPQTSCFRLFGRPHIRHPYV